MSEFLLNWMPEEEERRDREVLDRETGLGEKPRAPGITGDRHGLEEHRSKAGEETRPAYAKPPFPSQHATSDEDEDDVPSDSVSGSMEKSASHILTRSLASKDGRKQIIARSADEARGHIAAIRQRKCAGMPIGHLEDLESALELISNNLYRKPVHFVHELIQNADDNEYRQSDHPRMQITYEPGTLRFDTNEIGFTLSDVEAICSIGRSTKQSSSDSDRKIGEKGIGFKSVFKVSDEVYISSGHYSFMFTSGNPLGRLAPTWAEFPRPREAGMTSIFLRLSPQCDVRNLIDELVTLDGRIMAFLRKLEKITVRILEADQPPLKRSIGRTSFEMTGTKFYRLRLKPDHFSPYEVYNYPVPCSSDNTTKRGNRTQSNITLAFPSNIPFFGGQGSRPQPQAQQVFAYLPIRDYGFKFILQADFDLVGNREDIESSSAWNNTLLRAIPSAIAAAVDQFNLGVMRFSWLRYVPFRIDTEDFFDDVGLQTKLLLARRPILEADSPGEDLVSPSKLSIVPPKFLHHGEPLISPEDSKFSYVSRKYPAEATSALEVLGVGCLSDKDFLHDLQNFILSSPRKYRDMPGQWHNRLAEILEGLHASHERLISTLPLIPLRRGLWISPAETSGNVLLLPFSDSTMMVPTGIGILEIHRDVIYQPSWILLLRRFKARDADAALVCQSILEMHADDAFRPGELSQRTLISHVVFLCLAQWEPPKRHRDMWVLTSSGSVQRSSVVYIDSKEPFSASHIFAPWRNDFHFLHDEYSQQLQGHGRFDLAAWAQANLYIDYLPRLVRQDEVTVTGPPGHLVPSHDFMFLLEKSPTALLELLRRHWSRYNPLFTVQTRGFYVAQQGLSETSRQDQMHQALSNTRVRCMDGVTASLCETCLPRSTLLSNLIIRLGNKNTSSIWPLLDVPDPEDPSWDFLSTFGVTIEVGMEVLIKRLKQLQHGHPTQQEVLLLYDQLKDSLNGKNGDVNTGILQQAFRRDCLVFIPGPPSELPTSVSNSPTAQLQTWYSTANCVWEGPSCLKKIPCVQTYYPNHSELFHEKLALPIASLKTLVAEAALITELDSLDYIRELFIQLSQKMDAANYTEFEDSGCAKVLREGPIFPVWSETRGSGFDELRYAAMGGSWFVADVPYLLDSFEGYVPLLAFDPASIQEMRYLIDSMFPFRRLSEVAVKESLARSSEEYNQEYTRFLRGRAKYISRLVNDGSPGDKNMVISQLSNIYVCQVESISTTWIVDNPWERFKGRSERGRVMLKSDTQPPSLKVYLTSEDLRVGSPPLELMEELSRFCGIERQEYVMLLNHILVQMDCHRIAQDLQRRGIVVEIPDPGDDHDDIPDMSQRDPSWTVATDPNMAKDKKEHVQVGSAQDHIAKAMGPSSDAISNIPLDTQTADSKPHGDPYTMTIEVTRGRDFQGSDVDRFQLERSWWRPLGKNHGIMTISAPVIAVDHESDITERQFTSEFLVSSFLHDTLDGYSPSSHWTSPLRCRAGHKPLDSQTDASTFTIHDSRGMLRKFLQTAGYQDALCLTSTPIFHIQVVAGGSFMGSIFDIGSDQVRKSERLSLSNSNGLSTPKDEMFILVLVFGQDDDPQLALYPDPWQLHRKGLLSLRTYTDYEARFGQDVGPLLIHSPLDARSSAAPEASRKPVLFKYFKLGLRDIRLLELQPGDADQPLKGSINHVSLDKPNFYCAISYVWGSDSTLIFKDVLETTSGILEISVSLGDALRAVRQPKTSVMLWVDAVCINQADNHEKVMQIRLMNRIFSAAENVIAWLGHEYDGSNDAFGFLKDIGTEARAIKARLSETDGSSKLPASGMMKDFPQAHDLIWNKIDLLLDRRWFKRVWITQELVLPSTVTMQCGRVTISWDDFFEAIKICERLLNLRTSIRGEVDDMKVLTHAGPAYALGLTRRQLRQESKRHGLLNLLDLFSHMEAKIPRDKLFALLSLASDSSHEAFTPDYDSELDMVVFRYAQCFVSQGQAMELLYRAGLGSSHSGCSWIPDWTGDTRSQTISRWDTTRGRFHAGQRSPPVACAVPPLILGVRGFVVDSITSTTPLRTIMDSPYDATTTAFRRLLESSVGANSYPTGETREDLLFCLPIGSARRPHRESAVEQLHSYRDFVEGNNEWPENIREIVSRAGRDHDASATDNTLSPDTRRALQQYWETAAVFADRFTGKAVFCVTKGGYVGFAPSIATAGDSICVFHGAAVPFVVRRRDKAAHVLIGECYVHGIMYGEALKSEIREQEFELY